MEHVYRLLAVDDEPDILRTNHFSPDPENRRRNRTYGI